MRIKPLAKQALCVWRVWGCLTYWNIWFVRLILVCVLAFLISATIPPISCFPFFFLTFLCSVSFFLWFASSGSFLYLGRRSNHRRLRCFLPPLEVFVLFCGTGLLSNGDKALRPLVPGWGEGLRYVVEGPGWGLLSQAVVEVKPVITKQNDH